MRQPPAGSRVRRFTLVAAVVTAGLALAGPAAAAPVLVTAVADVTLRESGAAEVQIDYTVSGGVLEEPAAETLSFSALAFDTATVADVRVTGDGGEVLDTAVDTAGLKTTVTVTLPEPLRTGDELALVVTYAVPRAAAVDGEDLSASVPVLALDLPPAATAPGVFAATVALPSGYAYVSGFPSTPASVTSAGGSSEIRYEVPATTSVLRTVATTGDVPFFTLIRVIELLLLLVILASVAICLGYFARQRRLAAAHRGDLSHAPVAPSSDTVPASRERSH